MTVAVQVTDFEMFANNSKILEVTVRDDNGDSVDISGSDIKWALAASSWKRQNPPTAILTKTLSSGIVITDPGHGVFTVQLNPADTVNLKGGYYHEARVILPGGAFETVLTGKATIDVDLLHT